MFFKTIYKGEEYATHAESFQDAVNDLEELTGRPLPQGTEIVNRDTGASVVIDWTLPGNITGQYFTTHEAAEEHAVQCSLFNS